MPTLAAAAAIAGIVGTGASIASSIDSSRRQRNQAQDAQEAAAATAAEAQKQADMEFNRANQAAANAVTTPASRGAEASSTLLTGPQGVDPSALTLSKSTLLGS